MILADQKKTKKDLGTSADKQTMLKTNVKINSKDVFYKKGLKNPLAGFFYTIDGKKKKVLIKDITNKSIKNKLINFANKHNSTKIPEGKMLNPETGRFVKIKGETKTFQDPISLTRVKKSDGIFLNKTWYSKKSLQKWIESGKNTIPHSRRQLTLDEKKKIYTDKNGKIQIKMNKFITKTTNNNNNSLTFTFDSFDDFEHRVSSTNFVKRYIFDSNPTINIKIRGIPNVMIQLEGSYSRSSVDDLYGDNLNNSNRNHLRSIPNYLVHNRNENTNLPTVIYEPYFVATVTDASGRPLDDEEYTLYVNIDEGLDMTGSFGELQEFVEEHVR